MQSHIHSDARKPNILPTAIRYLPKISGHFSVNPQRHVPKHHRDTKCRTKDLLLWADYLGLKTIKASKTQEDPLTVSAYPQCLKSLDRGALPEGKLSP